MTLQQSNHINYSKSIYVGLPFDESLVKSDKKIEDGEILTLLKQSTNPRANKKKKKAAEKAAVEEGDAAAPQATN